MPADIAAVVHPAGEESLGIDELYQIARKYHGAGLVQAAGSRIVESLVRPLVIEHLPETVELSLLQPQGEGYWVRRVFFKRSVHPFMASVLLRLAGLNALMH